MPTSPTPARAPRAPRLPGAPPAALQKAARECTRFLHGDGPRTAERLLATVPTDTQMDYYGDGGVVEELEHEVAALLGKPAALFLPTGTMAQQATLRVHADRRSNRSVVFHPTCHLEVHEERAYQRLHGLFGVPVGSRHSPLTLADLTSEVHEPIAALLLELPQRDLGGTLPTWSELESMVVWARDRGAAVHMDGARLWEAAPYYARTYHKSIADVAGLFDTVYVSYYKGLGGLAGCCVAGEADVIGELSLWRTRHGGRAFGLWPLAASALTVMRERAPLMDRNYRRAKEIGRGLAVMPGVDVLPERVQTPMMHLRIHATLADIHARALEIARRDHVLALTRPFVKEGPRLQRFEFQVGSRTMELSVDDVVSYIAELAGTPRRGTRARR